MIGIEASISLKYHWEKNVFFKIRRPLIAAKYLIFAHRNGAVGRSVGRSGPKHFGPVNLTNAPLRGAIKKI